VTILVLWITILLIESRNNGLSFASYVAVVLQGSAEFVPQLPAISRGTDKGTKVNWTAFKITDNTVGNIAVGLSSPT